MRLSSLGEIVGGGTPKTSVSTYWDNGNIPWITPADMKYIAGKYIEKGSRNITEDGLKNSSACMMPIGTIIYSSRAPIGYIAITSTSLCTNQGFKSFVPIFTYINNYIYYCLIALTDEIRSRASGTTFKEISGAELGNTLIPFPPYDEQERIVGQIEKARPFLSEYDTIDISLQKLTLDFPIRLHKSILQWAVQGKLVQQDENDEPASLLLEQVRTEKEELIKQGKIKRNKKDSIIYRGEDNSYYERFTDGSEKCIDEEIPFEIPDSWKFVRLKHIGMIVGGGTPKTSNPTYWDGDIPWIAPSDLSNYTEIYISAGARTITELGLKNSSARLMPINTVLYSSRAPIGHSAISAVPVATNQGFKSIAPYDTSMSLFIYFCLRERTPSIVRRATGTTFKEISGAAMAETIIPVPPLQEQLRICKTIKSLFSIFEDIPSIIN